MGRISTSSPSSHGLDDTLRMWLTNPREGGRGREEERGEVFSLHAYLLHILSL